MSTTVGCPEDTGAAAAFDYRIDIHSLHLLLGMCAQQHRLLLSSHIDRISMRVDARRTNCRVLHWSQTDITHTYVSGDRELHDNHVGKLEPRTEYALFGYLVLYLSRGPAAAVVAPV